MVEEDFISAEIEIVPAFKARDVGIDRSMVGAYGQDDRASAYPLLEAICDAGRTLMHPALAMFIDKEEIGSEGNTGANPISYRYFFTKILKRLGSHRVGRDGAADTL